MVPPQPSSSPTPHKVLKFAAHVFGEKVRDPQAFVAVPQNVGLGLSGSTQQAPGTFGSGWSHREPEGHPQVRLPPHPSAI